jgi:hypothetical protein
MSFKNFIVSRLYVSDDGKFKAPMRVSSMNEYSTSIQVEVTVNDRISVIAN